MGVRVKGLEFGAWGLGLRLGFRLKIQVPFVLLVGFNIRGTKKKKGKRVLLA